MDRYQILWQLPKCNVYIAKDLRVGDRVVYKMTSRREVEVVNDLLLKVPEIMPEIRDSLYDEKRKVGYIIMELCSGDLTALVKKRLNNRDFIKQIMKSLTEQVKKLHSVGYAHMDLKPENVVTYNVSAQLRLIDFETATKQILLRELIGTPNFIPPEILKREEYHPHLADVWSLGLCFIYIATGKVIWELYRPDKQQTLLMGQYRSQHPKEPEVHSRIATTDQVMFPSSFDPLLIDLLSRMLEIDPKKRITLEEVSQHVFLRD